MKVFNLSSNIGYRPLPHNVKLGAVHLWILLTLYIVSMSEILYISSTLCDVIALPQWKKRANIIFTYFVFVKIMYSSFVETEIGMPIVLTA